MADNSQSVTKEPQPLMEHNERLKILIQTIQKAENFEDLCQRVEEALQ